MYYYWGYKNGRAAMQNSMVVPQKIKIEWPYDAEIVLLGVYPKQRKAGSWGGICVLMVISSIILNSQDKYLQYPLMNGWTKSGLCKQWDIILSSKRKFFPILPYGKPLRILT
jgi:hypothetical protein